MEHLTAWKAAMLFVAPFMRGHEMLRTWLALFGASVAGLFVHDLAAWIAIDAVAAMIVLRDPAGLAQKTIGALFALMVCASVGYIVTSHQNWAFFIGLLTVFGWLQWAILAGWIGHDLLGRYRVWDRALDRPPDFLEGRVP